MKNKLLFYSKILSSPSKCLFTVYKARKKKLVYVLSLVQQSVAVDQTHRKTCQKLWVTTTKVGIDILDQMTRYHTTKTVTRRWPIAIFCNILDCTCINAYILYCKVIKTQISRRDFFLALIKEMCKPKFTQLDCLSRPVRQVSSKSVMLQENANSVSFLHVKTNYF